MTILTWDDCIWLEHLVKDRLDDYFRGNSHTEMTRQEITELQALLPKINQLRRESIGQGEGVRLVSTTPADDDPDLAEYRKVKEQARRFLDAEGGQ
jgi:hypothetical protein